MIKISNYVNVIDTDKIAPFNLRKIERLREEMWSSGYEDNGVLRWDNGDIIAPSVLRDAHMSVTPKQQAAYDALLIDLS